MISIIDELSQETLSSAKEGFFAEEWSFLKNKIYT
jgi:hypothetical protein